MYSDEQLKEWEDNPTPYEDSQRQRAMERDIRKTKRELAGLDEAIKNAPNDGVKASLEAEFRKESVRLKGQEAKMKAFCKEKDLLVQNERVQVQGFGRSQAQKAVHAAKSEYKTLVDIIGQENAPSLDLYINMRYTNYSKYLELHRFAKYRSKVSNARISDFRLYENLHSKKLIKGCIVPASRKHAYILDDISSHDPAHISKRMFERGISADDVQSYVDNALFCEAQWGGKRLVYYSTEGIAVLTRTTDYPDVDWIAKTTWSKNDFGDDTTSIIKEALKYVKQQH